MKLKRILMFIVVLFLAAVPVNAADDIPSPLREMRAAWVATVANIDWPSKPGLSVEEQKKEAIVILDRVKQLNMNAVVFQVRPQADALYKSDLEPWSYYLTGQQGKAPEPFYDPLELWVTEAHARGLELHVWFNPYRANHPANKSELAPNSLVKAKPNLVKKLGNNGYYWMDPTMKEVQDHSYAVVMDVVRRYDIDGVHFDDYFYPYAEYNDGKDFPDDDTYKAYQEKGGKMERGDWRRDAVNKFIKRTYEGIKAVKPWVKFGISPFGTYRANVPAGYGSSFDQYATLYADAKLWLNKGWVDYFTPQLYWPISRIMLSYPVLLNWWASENTKGRNIWPGLSLSMRGTSKETATEIVNQIMVTRGIIPDGPGNMLFSMKLLVPQDSILGKMIAEGPYSKQALIPASPWLDKKAPAAPELKTEKAGSDIKISWSPKGKEKASWYVLYIQDNGKWTYEILNGSVTESQKKFEGTKITEVAVSAVDRCGNESKKTVIQVK